MHLVPTSKPAKSFVYRIPHNRSRRPQQGAQSNLTAQQGADMWKTYMQPLKAQGILLGSPAPSSAPSGKIWLQDFLTACNGGCTVDFIALHWYAVNSTEFIRYLQDFHDTFQRPIWVTEWACQVDRSFTSFNQTVLKRRHCRTSSIHMSNARNRM